jgi:hypothetical protein
VFEESVLEVGAEDMMAVLDAVDGKVAFEDEVTAILYLSDGIEA